MEMDDTKREHRNEIDQIRRENTEEVDRMLRVHGDAMRTLERRATVEVEDRLCEIERRNNAQLGKFYPW